MRSLVALASLVSIAHADPPNGYQCGPGTAKVGEGCMCPSGYVAKRADENIAICAPLPTARASQDCGKVEAGVALAFDLPSDARAGFRALAVKRCEADAWPESARACFAGARTEDIAFECVEKLAVAQRVALEADAAGVQPHGVVIGKSDLRFTGRFVFTERDQLHSSSDPMVIDLVRALAAQPAMRLSIEAHTNNREANDKRGTQGRADALRARLLASGIAADRVTATGYGADKPIAPNTTAKGRAANRRVSIAISGASQPAAPSSARVVVTDTTIELFDKVDFAFNKAEIRSESHGLLDEVVAILTANPGIALVEVQAHMDERGADASNLKITDERATAVVRYLTSKGIAPSRLVAKGYGETQPLYAEHNEVAWSKNRRIAFSIRTRR